MAEAEDGRPKGREGKEKQRISSLISTYHLYIIYIQLKSVKKALYPEVLDVRDDMEMI